MKKIKPIDFGVLAPSAEEAAKALIKLGCAFKKYKIKEQVMPLTVKELAAEEAECVDCEMEDKAREILNKMITMRRHAESVFKQMDSEYENMLTMSVHDLVLNYGKGAVKNPHVLIACNE